MDRQSIEVALVELDALISDPNSTEPSFQKWFETHSVVFDILGYTHVLPHPQLTESGTILFIPDFLGERIDQLWDIIEIKCPDTEVLKDTFRRQAFYAKMETYLSQAGQDYSKYFNDRSHREEFQTTYGMTVQEQPDTILIAGRSEGLDRQAVHRLLSGRVPRVTLQTYDDVRDRLEFQRLKSFGAYENLPGLSIHLVVMLEPPPVPIETYIVDVGTDPERNRVTVKTDCSGNVVFAVTDRHGQRHQTVIRRGQNTFEYGQTIYLCLEVGGSAERAMLLAEVNGLCCSEAKMMGFELEVEYPLAMVLGSDLTGKTQSIMRVSENIIYSRVLTFRERMDLRWYVSVNYERFLFGSGRKPTGIEFKGHQFMYSQGHPHFSNPINPLPRTNDMIQEDSNRKPRLRLET